MIVGGIHEARSLANSLIEKDYRVTVINKNNADCEKLAEINKLNVIYGDGSKKIILEDADAASCQVAIALILRGDQSLIPRGDTSVKEGDILIMLTSDKQKLD